MALSKTTKEYNGSQYHDVKIQDLEYGKSCTVELSFDSCRVRPGKFLDNDGKPKDTYSYAVTMIEPPFGRVSLPWVPIHLHRKLEGYRKGDVLKISAVPKEIEYNGEGGSKVKKTIKDYNVEKVSLSISDDDVHTIVEAAKGLPEKPSEQQIAALLESQGFKNAGDLKKVLAAIQSSGG